MTDKEIRLFEYMKHLSDIPTGRMLGRIFTTLLHFVTHAESLTRESYQDYSKKYATDLLSNKYSKKRIIEDFLGWCGEGFLSKTAGAVKLQRKALPDDIKEKINAFVTWLRGHYDYSENTIQVYCEGVKAFFRYCTEFNQDNVRAFTDTLYSEGKAPRTVNIRATALITYGMSIGVDIYIKRPKIQMALDMENVPSEKEVGKLTDYLQQTGKMDFYLYVRILSTSGCRCSEFLRLKWRDILNGVVVLKCKGNKFRRIFFSKSLAKEIKDFLKEKGFSEDDLVAMNRNNEPLSDRSFSQRLKDYADKCGVPREKIYPHAFRHYFAKQYLKRKPGDIVGLAELLGHSRLDTTRVYLQKTYDEQKRNYNRTVNW